MSHESTAGVLPLNVGNRASRKINGAGSNNKHLHSVDVICARDKRVTDYRSFFNLRSDNSDVLPPGYPALLILPRALRLAKQFSPDFDDGVLLLDEFNSEHYEYLRVDHNYRLVMKVEEVNISTESTASRVLIEATLADGDLKVWEMHAWLKAANGQKSFIEHVLADHEEPTIVLRDWKMTVAQAWRYAQLARDFRPLHTLGTAALHAGFSRPLAHPFWALGKCLAQLESLILGAQIRQHIKFHEPLLLPSEVLFQAVSNRQGCCFTLEDISSGQTRLSGEIFHAKAGSKKEQELFA